jgi:hypothetical protein
MTIQKIGFMAGWLAAILIELLAALGMAWITVHPKGRVENSPIVWFCVALPFALVLHFTVVRFAEATRIRNAAIRSSQNSVWTTVSGVREFMGLIKSGVFALLALAAFFWLAGLVQKQWARGELQVSIPTIAYGAGFLAYWCVLVPVYHSLRGKLPRSAGFQCTLAGDTLTFALGEHTFDVETSELIELRVLTDYAEGAAFFKRNVASNIPVAVQNPIQTTKWLARKINRPGVFIQPPSTGQASVFVRTSDLFLFAPLLSESVEVLRSLEKPSPGSLAETP